MDHKAIQSVLVINYYWPPAGGPAVQRWVDILKHWSGSGVSCYVLTVDPAKATYQVTDPSLAKQVPEDVKVFRTATAEFFSAYKKFIGNLPANAFVNEQNPSLKQKIARFIRGNFFIPDPRRGWNRFAFRKAAEIICRHSIDVVITAGPPHSTHLTGLRLKKRLGIKWIADFHDYWSTIFYLKDFYRTLPAKRIDACYEKKVLQQADLVLSHCQYARKLYQKRLGQPGGEKVMVHTMGYDEALFQPGQKPSPQQAFIITYSGMMPENYEPDVFFKALGRIVKDFPEVPVKIRFIGLFSPRIKMLIDQNGLAHHWEETGYVEHRKIPAYLEASSVLLLVNPNVKDEKMIVPGKIYEYLAVRKPVISISGKDSENASLLRLCEAGGNFQRDNEEGLYRYVAGLVNQWKKTRNNDLTHDNDHYLEFSRHREAMKLWKSISTLM